MTGISELVVARGDDARGYLQGQLTQDLAPLGSQGSAPTLLLDPKGTIVAVGVAHVAADDDVALEVPADVAGPVLARLSRFLLRAKVRLDVAGPPPTPWPWFASLRDRIDAGVPAAAELGSALVPHGLPAGLLERTVSFTKGCYPGQELVARMRARGASPPYVLRVATLPAPVEVGDRVGDPRFEGVVTSIAGEPPGPWRALVVLHRTDAARGGATVSTPGGDVAARLD